jgi:hypothetical protein
MLSQFGQFCSIPEFIHAGSRMVIVGAAKSVLVGFRPMAVRQVMDSPLPYSLSSTPESTEEGGNQVNLGLRGPRST